MLLRFADFEVDLDSAKLFCRGSLIPIQDKPLRVLAMLLARPGQLVTRKEISEIVWAGTNVSEDQSLNTAIRKIRLALDDSPDAPRFIETVGSRGYRFIAPVENVGEHDRTERSLTLAVLPLENLGPEQDDQFLAVLAEHMISELARLRPTVTVIALPSVLRYQDAEKNLTEIISELGADYLLAGSIRRAGPSLRIDSRLINGADQSCLWSQAFDLGPGDLRAVHNEVAEKVAASISRALAPASEHKIDPAAHELYLRGRYFWNKNTVPAVLKSVQLFNQSIARQADFPLNYVGLADAYIMLVQHGVLPGVRAYPVAKQAALKALALAPNIAGAYASLAWVKCIYDRNCPAAEADCRTAISLNPSYSFAYVAYAFLLTSQARHDESAECVRHGLQIDPVSLFMNAISASSLYLARRYAEAIERCQECIELAPSFPTGYAIYGQVLEAQGAFEEATTFFQRNVELAPTAPFALANLGRIHARRGQREQAFHSLNTLLSDASSKYVSPYSIASLYTGLGDHDSAFHYLQLANQDRANRIILLAVDPKFDSLRPDPRFPSLLKEIGLPTS